MDFTNPLSTPTLPPLARTSRHLRQVALPVSYRTQQFALSYIECLEMRGARTFKLGRNERIWLSCLSLSDIACIRSFHLTSICFDGISIDLKKSAIGFEVKVTDLTLPFGSVLTVEECQGLERELSKVPEKVRWVDGMRRFKIEDIHALRTGLEAAYAGLES